MWIVLALVLWMLAGVVLAFVLGPLIRGVTPQQAPAGKRSSQPLRFPTRRAG